MMIERILCSRMSGAVLSRRRARAAQRASLGSLILVFFLTHALFAVGSSDSLKTIDNPGGGQVVYGPLDGQNSMRDAMATMLRNVHGHFGEKPQIGKFFHAKNSDSVATFFSLTAKNQGGKRVAGLVIISMPQGVTPAAAVLFDDEARFSKTEPALMKKLSEAWQKETPRPVTSGTESSGASGIFGTSNYAGPVPALRQTVLSDNTASIGLPEGWVLKGGGGGAVRAAGPDGETIFLGMMMQNIYDPNNPRSQGMVQYLSRGNTPYFVCPYGGDAVQAYECVINQGRQRNHLPPLSLNVIDRKTLGSNQVEAQVVQVIGEADMHDGKGIQMASLRIGIRRPMGQSWSMDISGSTAPKDLADRQWPTIMAIIASHRQNGQAIDAENMAVVGQIHARAEANNALAKARSDANDAHNRQVEQTWDEQAKRNKAFENYQMDRTPVEYKGYEGTAHGTFENPTAEWLVKNDPDHFQYVPTQDLLKGIDY